MSDNIGESYKLDFKNPIDIYRVLAVIILSAIVSHVVYMYLKMPKGLPVSTDTIMLAAMITVVCIFVLAWAIWSNYMDVELASRFVYAVALSVLLHRIVVYENEVAGSLYAQSIFFILAVTALIFVVSGKSKNEFKIWLNVKFKVNEDDKKAKLELVPDDDSKSGTG